MINRPRRLRENPLIRGMVRETRASKDSLIYPIFFEEGKDIKAPISAMDGQFRYSPDRAKRNHRPVPCPRSQQSTALRHSQGKG